jgi:SNF2 family DNA or RNA helicase
MAIARTYGTMRRAGDKWVLDELEPHVCMRLKQLFPRIHKALPPPYALPADDPHGADLDWFLSRYPLGMTAEDRAALRAGRLLFEHMQAEMERILRDDYVPPAVRGLRPGQVIRPYQGQAVDVLVRSGGLLLGDEVGLGKSFVGAAACLAPGMLPAIVVCHPHLQQQWQNVIHGFTTLKARIVTKAKPYKLPPADVLIFRYSQLLGWADMLESLGARLVVFDEIQELRTGTKSGKGMAAARLASSATHRLGLSATPIYNYGTEIWTIMEYLRAGVLGPWDDFAREWTLNHGGRIKDPKALGSFLREQYAFLRRTKHDVGQQMPAVNRIVEYVEHDAEALRSVETLARSLALRATTGAFHERGDATRQLDLLMRHQTGVAKAKQVADFVRILVEAGEPVLLAGWHRDVYDIWLDRLADLRPAMYTGSETPGRKGESAAAFINGETDLMFISLRSGAGLDGLQRRCSTVVVGELDWSPGVHHQLIGRLDREGQLDPVTAIFLVSDDGSDPPMMEVLGLKASESAQILDPALGVTSVHSDSSPLQALVRRYLAKQRQPEEATA